MPGFILVIEVLYTSCADPQTDRKSKVCVVVSSVSLLHPFSPFIPLPTRRHPRRFGEGDRSIIFPKTPAVLCAVRTLRMMGLTLSIPLTLLWHWCWENKKGSKRLLSLPWFFSIALQPLFEVQDRWDGAFSARDLAGTWHMANVTSKHYHLHRLLVSFKAQFKVLVWSF